MKNTNEFKRIIHRWAWVALIAYAVIGLLYPWLGLVALACMLAPLAVAVFRGRLWCASFCPRGSFNDVVLSWISLKRRLPAAFKSTAFRLFFLAALLSAFGVQIAYAWGSVAAVGEVFVRMVILTTLTAIVLGIVYNARTWCGICPMGTLASYIAASRPKKGGAAVTACTAGCTSCAESCAVKPAKQP